MIRTSWSTPSTAGEAAGVAVEQLADALDLVAPRRRAGADSPLLIGQHAGGHSLSSDPLTLRRRERSRRGLRFELKRHRTSVFVRLGGSRSAYDCAAIAWVSGLKRSTCA